MHSCQQQYTTTNRGTRFNVLLSLSPKLNLHVDMTDGLSICDVREKKRLLRMHLTHIIPVVKYQWGGEVLLVSLSLIQGSDGSGDRGALFQQAKSCFPWECRVALWLCQHFLAQFYDSVAAYRAPSASMSRYSLKPSLPLYKGILH